MFDESDLIDRLDKLNNYAMLVLRRFNLELSQDTISAMNSLAELVTAGVKATYANKILCDDDRTIYQKAVSVKTHIIRELLHNIPTCRSSDPFVVATDIYRRQAMSEFLVVILEDVPSQDEERYQALVAKWKTEDKS